MSSPSEEEEEARETVIEKPNGDLHVTDVLGRTATLHWSRFHGLIVSSDHVAVYLGQPETLAWLASRVSTPPSEDEWQYGAKAPDGQGDGKVVIWSRHFTEHLVENQGHTLYRRRPGIAPGPWEPVPAVLVPPTEPEEKR